MLKRDFRRSSYPSFWTEIFLHHSWQHAYPAYFDFRIAMISLYNSLWRVRKLFPMSNRGLLLYSLSLLLLILFLMTSSNCKMGELIAVIYIRSKICIRHQVKSYNRVIDTTLLSDILCERKELCHICDIHANTDKRGNNKIGPSQLLTALIWLQTAVIWSFHHFPAPLIPSLFDSACNTYMPQHSTQKHN